MSWACRSVSGRFHYAISSASKRGEGFAPPEICWTREKRKSTRREEPSLMRSEREKATSLEMPSSKRTTTEFEYTTRQQRQAVVISGLFYGFCGGWPVIEVTAVSTVFSTW